MKKYEDVLNNHKLIDEQIRKQDERDFYHRNKLNSINNKTNVIIKNILNLIICLCYEHPLQLFQIHQHCF